MSTTRPAPQVPGPPRVQGADVRGSGPHDGMILDLVTDHEVVALAVFTLAPDGSLVASLSVRDGTPVTDAQVDDCLRSLSDDLTSRPTPAPG